MKRFNNLLFLIVFFLSVILSCSRRGENEFVIWQQMHASEREVLTELINKYMEENPGIKVSHTYYETEELRSNYIIAALGGSGPDLIHGPSDNIGPFDIMKLIKPMEDILPADYVGKFNPLGITRRSGHLYQIGDQIGNHLALVYNKKLVPNPPETMDELIEMGMELTKDLNGDGKTDQYALAWNFIEPFFFVPFIGGFDGWVMDENEMPTLNTPQVIDAMNFIQDLRFKYKIIPRECDLDIANMLFQQGKAAMVINGPWSWGDYIKNGVDIGLTRIPKITKTGSWPSPMVSVRGYSMNIHLKGERLKKAIDLLKFLTSPESELAFTRSNKTIPTRVETYDDPAVTEDEILLQSKYQLEAGKQMPISPNMRAIWDAMRPHYQALLNGSKTAEEAAEAMQKESEKRIRDMVK